MSPISRGGHHNQSCSQTLTMSKGNKGKNANAGKGKGVVIDDDELDALLREEAEKNKAAAAAQSPPAASPAPAAEDDDDDDDDDDNEEGPANAQKKDKKKKKKKKPAEKKEEAKSPGVPKNAAAKLALERLKQKEEEEARLKALQEEEERKIREEEERLAAEERAIEEEKARKAKAKADKIQKQKDEGTYMTKAEKEKKKKEQERLAVMMRSGYIVAPTDAKKEEEGGEKQKVVYTDKKKDKKKVVEAVVDANEGNEGSDDFDWDEMDSVDIVVNTKGIEEADQRRKGIEYDKTNDDKNAREAEDRIRGAKLAEVEAQKKAELAEQQRIADELAQKKIEADLKTEMCRRARVKREEEARDARKPDNLRAPISVIMGHVDTGKTKLLDKIRQTNVQEGEAGGITQQIGATHFPRETLISKTDVMQKNTPFQVKIPGLLMIDTPGHESFSNLRSRGSSLCDIAIVVIDLMHGLEPQTIESIRMLRDKQARFIVALNKVDRLYGWRKKEDRPIREALAEQDENCMQEFRSRLEGVQLQLSELGLNSKLYWENDDLEDYVSLCPTSAITGEGVPDLLMNLIRFGQERLVERLMYMEYLQCTVLEVKVIDGYGPTVDVVLVNGTLREGDKICISTMDGAVITTVRSLLTPPPNSEMRVKNDYLLHSAVQGAMGVKIVANDLQRAIAGTPLMVITEVDDEEDIKEVVQSDFNSIVKLDDNGVTVHASTLGALEALLQFLRKDCKPPIPVSQANIGTIFKKDVMKAAIMNGKDLAQFATILAFDVKIDPDAAEYARDNNVRIFTADIIYHLFDQFKTFMTGFMEERKAEAQAIAVFPSILRIIPDKVFNNKNPIVLGVEIIDGTLRIGTPLCIPQLNLHVGKVVSIQNNHKDVTSAKKGMSVAIKIENSENENIMVGRQFNTSHALYSQLTRKSIDALKEYFKDEVKKEEWALIVKMKKTLKINDPYKSSSSSAASTPAVPTEEETSYE